MNRDISQILAEWPYDPSKVNVRLIQNEDGEPVIQIRLDLGILQLRYDGRPDGQSVNGYPSLLEYFEARADGTEPDPDADAQGSPTSTDPGAKGAKKDASGGRAPGAESPGPVGADRPRRAPRPQVEADIDDDDVMDANAGEAEEDDADHESGEDGQTPVGGARPERAGAGGEDKEPLLVLGPEECRALRDEAAQYYHRYVALLILEDYEGVVRDTTRNLRVLDLCGQFAEAPEDRQTLEQFRAYIMMMRARALASQALRDGEPKAAVVAIDEGLEALRKYYADQGEPEAFASSNEAAALQEMRDGLVPKLPTTPPSQAAELRQRLQHAIDQENYELAAILRDELRLVQERGPGGSAPA